MKKLSLKIVIILVLPLAFSCNLRSDVTSLDPSKNAVAAPVTSSLEGFEIAPAGKQKLLSTPDGYEASFTMHGGPQEVKGTTSGGYDVYLNFQGQMASE